MHKKIEKIAKDQNKTKLTRRVAADAIKYGGKDAVSFLNDVVNYGCESGLVGSLIYNKDVYRFFDKYYNDILDVVNDLEEELQDSLKRNGRDIKVFYTWAAYEEIAKKILYEQI